MSSAKDVELDRTKDKSKQNARLSCKECHLFQRFFIYTTKIEAFVSPPNISETVAVHRLLTVHQLVRVSVSLRVKFRVRARDMAELKLMNQSDGNVSIRV